MSSWHFVLISEEVYDNFFQNLNLIIQLNKMSMDFKYPTNHILKKLVITQTSIFFKSKISLLI